MELHAVKLKPGGPQMSLTLMPVSLEIADTVRPC